MIALLALALRADPPSAVAEAVGKSRAERNYEFAFSSETRVGRGDALKRRGSGAWWKPAALVLDYESSGNEKVLVVRAGNLFSCGAHSPAYDAKHCGACGKPRRETPIPRVWTYTPLFRWSPPDVANLTGAGMGYQNPDRMLELLEGQAAKAKAERGGFRIVVEGGEAIKLAQDYSAKKVDVAREAELSAWIKIDPRGRIASVEVRAKLSIAEGEAEQSVKLEFLRYGEAVPPETLGRPAVALSPELKDALAEALK